MKRVLMTGLMICMALALAAPALADGAEAECIISKGRTVQKPRPDFPLKPGKTLTLRLKAGTGSGTFDHKFTPTREAVGGHFARQSPVNVTLENCQTSYPFTDTNTFTVKCKLTLKDKSKDGLVPYKNVSNGDLILHF